MSPTSIISPTTCLVAQFSLPFIHCLSASLSRRLCEVSERKRSKNPIFSAPIRFLPEQQPDSVSSRTHNFRSLTGLNKHTANFLLKRRRQRNAPRDNHRLHHQSPHAFRKLFQSKLWIKLAASSKPKSQSVNLSPLEVQLINFFCSLACVCVCVSPASLLSAPISSLTPPLSPT